MPVAGEPVTAGEQVPGVSGAAQMPVAGRAGARSNREAVGRGAEPVAGGVRCSADASGRRASQ
jgi:hypothetical protein